MGLFSRQPAPATTLERSAGALVERIDQVEQLLERSTVGGGAELGLNVMYPASEQPDSQAWAGWPVSWDTPPLEPIGGSGVYSGFGYGRLDPSGYLQRVSTVMTCTDINSQQLASFPIYEIDAGDRRRPAPEWGANPEPELYADWSEFAVTAVNSLQLEGEIFLYATGRYFNGQPARFIALSASAMEVHLIDGRLEYTFAQRPIEDPADILHIKYQSSPDSLRGIGPLQWVGRNLVAAAALEQYGSDIARHGLWAVLKHPGNLNTTQRDDLKTNWMQARRSGGAAPAVLSGGVEFEALNLSPTDMALLDLLTFHEQRIAAALGVPPYLVGLEQAGGMTYANAESLYDFHWRSKLRPLANKIAQPMSNWLLPPDRRFEFDRDEYVKPALGDRAAAWATMFNIVDDAGDRVVTVDEIRKAERYGPAKRPDGQEQADSGRSLSAAEVVQKVYLGVANGVITVEEARKMISDAGAELGPTPPPPPPRRDTTT